jgi:hypothetical protein
MVPEGSAQLLFAVLLIGGHVEGLVSLAAFMDAHGLEVLQQKLLVILVQKRKSREGFHIKIRIEHQRPVGFLYVGIVQLAVVPLYIIRVVSVLHIHHEGVNVGVV